MYGLVTTDQGESCTGLVIDQRGVMYWVGDHCPGGHVLGVMYGLVTTDQGESCTGLVIDQRGVMYWVGDH